MPDRFEIHTVKRSGWRGLADHYVTTIYDRDTSHMVTCAGDTSAESEASAWVYLAMLSALKNPNQRV